MCSWLKKGNKCGNDAGPNPLPALTGKQASSAAFWISSFQSKQVTTYEQYIPYDSSERTLIQ